MACLGFVGLILSQSDFSESHTLETLILPRPDAKHIYGPSAEWIEGKDGWLFLGNAVGNTIAKLKLAQKPGLEEIEEKTQAYAALADVAALTSTPVILLVGPNKATIYPEFLPDELRPSETRYLNFFTEPLSNVPNLTVIDPTRALRDEGEEAGFLYYRTDTHWNNKGAFLAFSTMADQFGWPVPEVSFSPGSPHAGDLMSISNRDDFPIKQGDSWVTEWKTPSDIETKPISNQPETAFGRAEVSVNKTPLSSKTVWVIGDSFTGHLAPFLQATFAEVRFLGHVNQRLKTLPVDLRDAKEHPDIVLFVRVERSF